MPNHDNAPMVMPPYPSSVDPSSPPPRINYDYYSGAYKGRESQKYLHTLFNTLLRRKWWIIGTFLSIFLLAAAYTFLRTPIFRTAAILQITQADPASQVSMDGKFSKLTGSDLFDFQHTQYKILQSESLAGRVIQNLNLSEHPDFKPIREKNSKKSPIEIENEMITTFLKRFDVTPVRNSFLVKVGFQSPDKFMAQRVVNAIADEYTYLSIDRRKESFALVREWLDKQVKGMAAKLQVAQKKLYKFGQENDIYTLEDKDNVVVKKFIDLNSLVTTAQAEKMAKEGQFKQIEERGPNAPLIVNHPLVADLRRLLVAQQAKASSMNKIYRGEHPEMLAEKANLAELRSRLQAEVQRLQQSVKADYEAASRTEKLLSDSLANQKREMANLQNNLSEYQILKRDAQTNEQLYQALLARVKEANIAATMIPANVAIIDPARLPEKPCRPQPVRDLALASVLGLTLGIGIAFLMEHLDDSIKSVEDLERFCNIPSLGVLPLLGINDRIPLGHREKPGVEIAEQLLSVGQASDEVMDLTITKHPQSTTSQTIRRIWSYPLMLLRRGQASGDGSGDGGEDMDLIITKYPQSPASEAFRHTHTAIMLSVSGKPPGAIMVTSPNSHEGKTLIASNLAMTFALSRHQTLLIDCDMRKPRIHKIFKLDLQPGLSNYLTGNATQEEILHSTSDPNLTVITSGAPSPTPGNLLNSIEFKDLITQLRQRFDHIIIDTPPILGFSDGLIVSVQTDGVLLVTKHNSTDKSAGRMAHQILSQIHAPLMGAVLNFVSSHGKAYYDLGHYHYEYHDVDFKNNKT